MNGDVVLRIRSLAKRFEGRVILDNVSIECRAGDIKVLIGPNGSGKTTLLNLVNGILPPDKGQICIRGRSALEQKPHETARLGVGRLFQELRLFPSMTAKENCLIPFISPDLASIAAAVLQGRRLRADVRALASRYEQLFRALDLAHLADIPVRQLSLGQQRVVALARALGPKSHLLLLDEPSAGLDSTMSLKASRVIVHAARSGAAVLVAEHDMDFVELLTDKAILLRKTGTVEEGRPSDLAKKSLPEAPVDVPFSAGSERIE